MKPAFDLDFPGVKHTRICIGAGALVALPEHLPEDVDRVALVGDRRVLDLFEGGLRSALDDLPLEVGAFGFPPGEASKVRATKERIEDELREKNTLAGIARARVMNYLARVDRYLRRQLKLLLNR